MLDMSMMYKASFTAYYNCNRPKRKKALKLFDRRSQRANVEAVENNIAIAVEVEAKEGNDWIDKVLYANGIKKKGGKD